MKLVILAKDWDVNNGWLRELRAVLSCGQFQVTTFARNLPSASSAPDTQSPTRPHGTLVRKAATHWEKMWIDFSGISPLGVGFFSVFILMFEECILMFEECTGGLVLLFWGSLGILLYIILYIYGSHIIIYMYI